MGTDHAAVNRHAPLAWVVVANAARARVFERNADNGALRELADLVHPASRLKGTDLGSDRPGRAFKGDASTAFAPHTAPQDREHARFAHELAQMLDSAALEHQMPSLVLLVSAPFLGDLRAQLGAAAQALLTTSAAIDLTAYQGAELEQRVSHALQDRG